MRFAAFAYFCASINEMKITRAIPEDVAALNRLVNSAYRGEDSKKGWTTEAAANIRGIPVGLLFHAHCYKR